MAASEIDSRATKRTRLHVEDDQPPIPAVWRLYPPSSSGRPPLFGIGTQVFVRPKSTKENGRRGTVVEPVSETTTGHAWVQCGNSKPTYVSCKRLVPVFEGPSVILTPETIPYRHLCGSQVTDQDHVLEIGISTGQASELLYRYGRSWVGLDSSVAMVEHCSARLQSLAKDDQLWHACKMDALADSTGAQKVAKKFSGQKGPSVVFLDIGGDRAEAGVIEMMSWVFRSFSSLKVLVIKSRQLVKDLNLNKVDCSTGLIPNGSLWFQEMKAKTLTLKTRRHPLQAPLVYVPCNGTQPVCRYHNYDPKGCKKGETCPFNHDYCHLCLQLGHRALHCGNGPSSEKIG